MKELIVMKNYELHKNNMNIQNNQTRLNYPLMSSYSCSPFVPGECGVKMVATL
jgi:hypothetical protein